MSECPQACLEVLGCDAGSAYLIGNTTASECLCCRDSCFWGFDDNCTRTDADTDLQVTVWEYSCWMEGRPYNLPEHRDVRASVQQVDCGDCVSHDDAEWRQFLESSHRKHNASDAATSEKWAHKALAEHASIATFSRFSLDLLSLGAPLWLVQLSLEASLDEVRHAEVSFDIANLYREDGAACLSAGAFPSHSVEVSADWNAISRDAARGGCVGETAAALRMTQEQHGGLVDVYVRRMAEDEVRHSALAWVSVKWMMDSAPSDVSLEVRDAEWWLRELKSEEKANVVMQDVIMSTLSWVVVSDADYRELYRSIVAELMSRLPVVSPSVVVE